jgi:hypothetical protein
MGLQGSLVRIQSARLLNLSGNGKLIVHFGSRRIRFRGTPEMGIGLAPRDILPKWTGVGGSSLSSRRFPISAMVKTRD